MPTAYLCLGSNLDDPSNQIRTALNAIETLPETTIVQYSDMYITRPWGPVQDQPPFYNAVVEIETTLSATALLDSILTIEQQQGRERTIIQGPRTLDCDILLYGDEIIQQAPELVIPHPRMHERAFVIVPLAEIAPHLRLPTGQLVQDLLAQCDKDSIIERQASQRKRSIGLGSTQKMSTEDI